MRVSLFTGADSLRVRGERRRLTLTLLFLPVTLAVVGFFFENTFTLHSLLLIVIGAMLFVALSRGRFLGGGVRIRAGQFDHVYEIVAECARTIGIPEPHVFVRDDPFVPIVAVGTGEPYALVISAQWVELFSPDELRFLAGRELAHIASGHTKLTSLLSANGRENAVIAIAFGAWLRTIEYTADRIGLLCCRSLEAAFSAIAVSTFHKVGRRIDLHSFAEQRRELDAEPSLRLGEWLSSTPYATNRIARLAAFARDPLFLEWSKRFESWRDAPPAPADDTSRFAGFWRRATAFVIDYIIVSALNPASQRALHATLDLGDTRPDRSRRRGARERQRDHALRSRRAHVAAARGLCRAARRLRGPDPRDDDLRPAGCGRGARADRTRPYRDAVRVSDREPSPARRRACDLPPHSAVREVVAHAAGQRKRRQPSLKAASPSRTSLRRRT
jgi:Zn-dependent protease with chaperone function